MVWKPTEETLDGAVAESLAFARDSDLTLGELHNGLMAWLSDWADEIRAQANEATVSKIKAAIDEVFWPPQASTVQERIMNVLLDS